MKLPRIELGSLVFAILVLALDFAVLRWALTAHYQESPAISVLLLLPMFDGLLVALYRLRRPSRRTAGAIGFILGGTVATGLLVLGFVVSSEAMFAPLLAIGRPLAQGILNGLTRGLGNAWMQSWPMSLALGISLELLFPVAFYCLPAFLAALCGARVAAWLGSKRLIAEV
jgi:hypothetical protein